MEKIFEEAEKRVERMVSEYAYQQTNVITDKDVRAATFVMIESNIMKGARMTIEAIKN